jgi:hypothetical protein
VAEPETNEIFWGSVFAEPRRTETPEGMKARFRLPNFFKAGCKPRLKRFVCEKEFPFSGNAN